jgi:hypothetical protein
MSAVRKIGLARIVREASGYSSPALYKRHPAGATAPPLCVRIIQTEAFGIKACPEPTDLGVRGWTPLGRAKLLK